MIGYPSIRNVSVPDVNGSPGVPAKLPAWQVITPSASGSTAPSRYRANCLLFGVVFEHVRRQRRRQWQIPVLQEFEDQIEVDATGTVASDAAWQNVATTGVVVVLFVDWIVAWVTWHWYSVSVVGDERVGDRTELDRGVADLDDVCGHGYEAPTSSGGKTADSGMVGQNVEACTVTTTSNVAPGRTTEPSTSNGSALQLSAMQPAPAWHRFVDRRSKLVEHRVGGVVGAVDHDAHRDADLPEPGVSDERRRPDVWPNQIGGRDGGGTVAWRRIGEHPARQHVCERVVDDGAGVAVAGSRDTSPLFERGEIRS